MYLTSGFRLVIIWGYLCKLQYVYILTYCPKPTTSIILLQYNYFPDHFLWITYNLLIASCAKTQNSFVQLLALRLNQLPIQWKLEASSSGVQQPCHLVTYSPPSSADVNMWSCTSSPQYAITAYPGMALTLPLIKCTALNSKQDNLWTQAQQPILKIKIWIFQEWKLILQSFS